MLWSERDRLLDVYVAKAHLYGKATSALVAAAGTNMETFAELLAQCRQAGTNIKEARDALRQHSRKHGCWIPYNSTAPPKGTKPGVI